MAVSQNAFTIGSRLEILHILHALMRKAALITVNVDAREFFLTSLLGIDEKSNRLYFERGRAATGIPNIRTGQKISYRTKLEQVEIRFSSTGLHTTIYGGNEVYEIPLPEELQRLQRRESYRVHTPLIKAPKCRLTRKTEPKPDTVELNIINISCGGIAIQCPPDQFKPQIGDRYDCVLLLPDTPGLQVTVTVCDTNETRLLNGKKSQHTGCAFVAPPESTLAIIQRYIMVLERQQRTQHAMHG